MKKVWLMGIFVLVPGLLAAEPLNFEEFLGESWYGLYLNGEKAGYSLSALEQDGQGRFVAVEDAHFHISMSGIKQDMHIYSRRIYGADGALEAIESRVVDPTGPSEFNALVEGDELLLTNIINGVSTEKRLPRPQESLEDALKYARWVREKPAIGDTLEFTVFEPMYEREVEGTSYIVGQEERVFGGVKTEVYKIKTVLSLMGVESISYVTEDGTTLEDVVAGIITMRLEPEEIAKDVDYNHDAIISNAALLDAPIRNARDRDSLRLHLEGPLTPEHLFNDARQSLVVDGDKFLFEATRLRAEDVTVESLPVEDEELNHWTEATLFVQSDDPRIIAKAREIVGNETDALKISNLLSEWVHRNMRSTFSARLTNALEVLDSMEGDCTEHSILFIALARAAGLPAREVAGLVYVDDVQPGFYFHQWAKVWVGQWIDVDPTFNMNLAGVAHIKLAEGDLFRQARLIPVIGQLEITVLEDAPRAAAAS